jgi:hypothetical protein
MTVEVPGITDVEHPPTSPNDWFVVIPHYWGRGVTEEAAIKAMVAAGGRRSVERVVFHFPPETTRVWVINDYGQVGWVGPGPISIERVGPRGKRVDITQEALA